MVVNKLIVMDKKNYSV